MVDLTNARPLTAEELQRYRSMHSDSAPACAGPCDQGRKPCPVPEACEAPTREPFDAACVIAWVMGTIGAWAAIMAFVLTLKS
jgi:hypothetical protein